MYALLACLTLLSWYYFADLVNGRDWNEHKYSVLAYLLSTVLLGYTHAFGLFVILAQSIYVSILIVHSKIGSPNPSYSRSPGIIRWVSAQTIITALLSPWLVILVSRRGTDAISWISTPNPKGLLMSIHNFFFEYGLHLELFPGKTLDILLMGVFGIFSAIALIVHRENGRLRFGPSPGPLMFSLLFLTPLIGSFVVSILLRPIFIQRYLISGALGLYLLIGAGVSIFVKLNFSGYFSRSSISPFQLSVRHVILTLIILTLFIPIPEYYSEQHHEQWREATQTIEGNASDEAAILFTNNISVHPYRYYSNRDDLTLYSLGEHEAWSSVSARLLEHDEIWVVHSHDSIQIEDGYLDPARQTYGVTEVGQFIGVRIFKLDR